MQEKRNKRATRHTGIKQQHDRSFLIKCKYVKLSNQNTKIDNELKIKIMMQLYAIYKRLTSDPDTHRLKVKGWEKISQSDSIKQEQLY
jgi:hypothetical protein